MRLNSLPAGAAIILASLLVGGTATSTQRTPPPQLQILQWSAPSPPGNDVYTAPLVFSKTRYATCGPYTLTTHLTLDRKKLHRRPPRRGWPLVSLGGAGSIRLLRDQRLSVTRLFAHRTVPTPTFTTARSLAHLPAEKPITIQLTWTGRQVIVNVNGRRWLAYPCQGTRALGALRVGPFPGRVHQLSLKAR